MVQTKNNETPVIKDEINDFNDELQRIDMIVKKRDNFDSQRCDKLKI